MGVRVLLAAPEPAREALARRLLAEAERAEDHVRSSGRWHPQHGSGSLRSAAQAHQLAPLPPHCNKAYRAALAVVLSACAEARLP